MMANSQWEQKEMESHLTLQKSKSAHGPSTKRDSKLC
jgi:hypothetical protein